MAKKKATKKKAVKKSVTKARPASKAAKTKKKAATKKRNRKPGNTSRRSVMTQLEALKRDEEILQHYRDGLSIAQIAIKVGRDPKEIRKAVQRTRQRWRDDNTEAYEGARFYAESLCKQLINLALEGYQKSEMPDRIERVTTTTGEDGTQTLTVLNEVKMPAAGRAEFLRVAERACYQLAQINGLCDHDRHNNKHVDETRAALVEVIITTPEQKEALQQMTFNQLAETVVERDGVELITDSPR